VEIETEHRGRRYKTTEPPKTCRLWWSWEGVDHVAKMSRWRKSDLEASFKNVILQFLPVQPFEKSGKVGGKKTSLIFKNQVKEVFVAVRALPQFVADSNVCYYHYKVSVFCQSVVWPQKADPKSGCRFDFDHDGSKNVHPPRLR